MSHKTLKFWYDARSTPPGLQRHGTKCHKIEFLDRSLFFWLRHHQRQDILVTVARAAINRLINAMHAGYTISPAHVCCTLGAAINRLLPGIIICTHLLHGVPVIFL